MINMIPNTVSASNLKFIKQDYHNYLICEIKRLLDPWLSILMLDEIKQGQEGN